MGRRGWQKMTRTPEDNSTDEMNVTEEMIEAGIMELGWFVFEFDRETDAVEAIYRAMRALAPAHRS